MSDCNCSVGRRTPRLSAAFLAGYCGGYAAGRLAQIRVDVTSVCYAAAAVLLALAAYAALLRWAL